MHVKKGQKRISHIHITFHIKMKKYVIHLNNYFKYIDLFPLTMTYPYVQKLYFEFFPP